MPRTIALVADALVMLLSAVVLAIVLTGGGVFTVAGQRISATGVDNPLLALTLIAALRYGLLRRIPFAGRGRWSIAVIETRARDILVGLQGRLEGLSARTQVVTVVAAALAATAIKIVLAGAYPGFFSGDDVEIHEMSIGALWNAPWPIWDLRNAVFPLGVVYPAQKLAAAAGIDDPAALVLAGRLPVAVSSSLTIVLLWRAGRELWPRAAGYGVVAAILFATSQLHIAFGSSELPRPVATVLVTSAFVLLLRPHVIRVAAAGVVLGLAASFRFSEAIFIVPALITLAWQRRWGMAALLALCATGAAVAAIAVSDAFYWGEAFHSVKAAVDYTLVQRLSSRGYQSVAWYLLHVLAWVNPAVLVLAAVTLFRNPRLTDTWVWAPVLLLSLLPHKEARYMIPVVPFVCLTAARGLQVIVAAIADDDRSARRPWVAAGLIAMLGIGVAHDAGHWRLPRSNADVAFARALTAAIPANQTVAMEQVWRAGGRLYLHPREVVDLDPDRLGDPQYLPQSLPSGGALALDSRTVARYQLEPALQAGGYELAPLVVPGSRYRLWIPATRREHRPSH